MRKNIALVIVVLLTICLGRNANAQEVEHLTAEKFRAEIFDYKANTEWKFEGDIPVVIDFYATWCGPCRRVAPIFNELQEEYKGKIKFYKVNVDKEKELAGVFGVRSIPNFIFIPKKGEGKRELGLMEKARFKEIFKELFDIE